VYVVFDSEGNPAGLSSDMDEPINYSRRSPWPIINILRAAQVSALQKNVPEGKIYKQNVERLEAVGLEKLQDMLDRRDWTQLPVHSAHAKLNRAERPRGSA